jgi:hypothetical protein
VALALSSCTGGLAVTVTSVTGTLEPYNPALRSSGVPAEQVDFTVGDYAFGSAGLVCLISVRDAGQLVGSAIVTFGSRGGTPVSGALQQVAESVAVDITLPSPCNGPPFDASAGCGAGR